MGQKRKAKRKRPAENQEIRNKETVETKIKTSKQNNSKLAVKSLEVAKKKGNKDKSASDLVGTVAGIVGGTMAGALIWPFGLILGGPVGGIILGAGAAGLFGVAIQDLLSKHDQLMRFLLIILGVFITPVLLYIVFRTTTFEYNQEEPATRGIIHLE